MSEIIVRVENITKKYRKKIVLNDISLTINAGDRIGIVGSNGAGKTTLCETIAQLRVIKKGKIFRNFDKTIGMQLQDSRYPKGITGYDILELYINSYRLKMSQDIINSVLEYLEIKKFMNINISKLSGGQQQKINIFLALIINPDLVILDELANGLDLEVKDKVYNLISNYLSNEKKSLILISHNMSEIEKFCTELIFLSKGKIEKRILISDVLKKFSSVEEYVKSQFQYYNDLIIEEGDNKQSPQTDKWKQLWN